MPTSDAPTVPSRHPLTGEIRQVAIPPDKIANLDANGILICFVPDYSKPGVFERVARDCFEDELLANPPTSSIGLRLAAEARKRMEEKL